MSVRFVSTLAGILLLLWVSFVSAGVLPGLLGEIPVYPNATVKKMEHSEALAYVTLQTAAPFPSIVDFYKSRLLAEDWVLEMEIVSEVGATAFFSRLPGDTLDISVTKAPGGGSLITTTIARETP